MASKSTKKEPKVPMWHATVAWKLWARRRLKEKGWTKAKLADEIKVSGETITQLLGARNDPPVPSNTEHMPAINSALGAAPPPTSNPDDPLSEVKAWMDAAWPRLDPSVTEAILALLKPSQH